VSKARNAEGAGEAAGVSLVRGDALFRLQRAVGLIPPDGLGLARRILLFVAVTWLPLVLWAAWRGRVVAGGADDPLLAHFGIHVRCLVAIPLLVMAEGVAQSILARVVPQFLQLGLVADRGAFERVLGEVARLRDRSLPWVVILGLVAAWTVLAPIAHEPHEIKWAVEASADARLGFGGWWYLYVARPIFLTLVLAWLWRIVLAIALMRRIAALELSLVPTHPDGQAGLGFLESLPAAFVPVVFALSAVLASAWAHDVVYHGVSIASLRLPAAGFLVLVSLLFLAPLLAFAPLLSRVKREARAAYAALLAEHGRAVHERWIERRPRVENELLSAPEIGPVADTHAIYHAVARIAAVPVGRRALGAVIAPAVVPMIVVAMLQIPAKDLLLMILKALA
jgi:hypothetical protein